MKVLNYILAGYSLLSLTACGNEMEKKAAAQLNSAQNAYQQGRYLEAKQQIDSIKILYPKAFEARKAGQALILDVEWKIQEQKMDSLHQVKEKCQQLFSQIKGKYILEKDTAYQQIGHYIHPTQVIEKNLHRAYLRFQVDERGLMSMTSIYCGQNNIHHIRVKVQAPDQTYAETPSSKDMYETSDLSEKIEKADYKLGEDGGVIDFIRLNKNKNIRVTFMGDRSFTTQLMPADREAATQVYELAQVLSQLTQIEKEEKAAQLKMTYIQKKKERKAQEAAVKE